MTATRQPARGADPRSADLRHGAARTPSMPLLLALSSLGAVLAPLNSTMIAIALPEIRQEFDLSHAAVGWLISGYLIAMAVVQPLGGRLGDQIGRARVYRAGLLAFLVLSVAATIAPSFELLVAFRMAQAVAGAVLMPNGMAMLRAHAPPEQLGRLNGLNGSILSGAAALGPLLGAAALAMGSWRFVFPLSIPLVLAALVLLQRMNMREEQTRARSPIDWLGIGLFVALLSGLTLQLASVREPVSAMTSVLRWTALGAVAVAFAWRQLVTPSPAAEWRLFRQRSFAAATTWILLTNLTMYTTLLMLPFFIRDVQGKSTEVAGLLLGAMSVLVAITSPVGGRMSDAFGRSRLALAGASLALAGSLMLLAGLRSDVHASYLALSLAVVGLGLGLGIGAAQTAAIESAPIALAGTAAGTSSMMRYAGSIIGAGVLAGVLRDDTATDAGSADIATFRLVMLAVAITAALAVAASTMIHRFARQPIIAVDGDQRGTALPNGTEAG